MTATQFPLQSARSAKPIGRIDPHKGFLLRRATNRTMLILTGLMTVLAIVPLVWIIGYVFYRGGQYIDINLFTQLPRPMGMPGGGVLHSIQGTLILAVIAAIFAIPPGVLAAFYAAYNPNTPLGIVLRFGTDVLSGVPSIVVGIFAYALIVKPAGHYSAIAGGFAMAIIMLPTIIRTTEEMIKLVPRTLNEGSLALGAPEWKTSIKVVLPAAISGIVTGFMLALARAAGETAPLLFTALGNDRFEVGRLIESGLQSGNSLPVVFMNILQQPVDSLPLTLYKYTQQPGIDRINQSWAVAFVLMLIVLLVNITARIFVEIRMSKLRGH
jgi:phosphate transport system permease protein